MHQIIRDLVVSIYWFSFVWLGAVSWLCIGGLFPKWRRKDLGLYLLKTPLPGQALLFFFFGVLLMVPITAIGYLFGLNIIVVTSYFLTLVVCSIGLVFYFRKNVWAYLCHIGKQFTQTPKFALVIFFTTALFVFSQGIMRGALMSDGTDSYVHISKISQTADSTLTINDAYFDGVVETRYHTNILYVLYANAVHLLNVDAINIWQGSFAFFSLMALCSLLLSSRLFLPTKWGEAWPYIIAALSFMLSAYIWRKSNYPNEAVLLWITIFIVGLQQFFVRQGKALLIFSALLIALTHPTYALMSAAFTCMVITVMHVFGRTKFKFKQGDWAALAIILLVLLTPIIFSLSFPNRMSIDTFNFTEPESKIQLENYGPLKIITPVPYDGRNWESLFIILTSSVGYIWLFLRSPTRINKIIIGNLVIFYACIAYNPLVFAIFSKDLPVWLVQRFSYFNRLASIAAATGLLVITTNLVNRYMAQKRALITPTLVSILILLPFIILQYQKVLATQPPSDRQTKVAKDLGEFKTLLSRQKVYATEGVSFLIPAVAPNAKVVWMPKTNASPMADMEARTKCGQELEHELRIGDLADAHITRVVAGNWNEDIYKLAITKDYLKKISTNKTFTVFEVDYSQPYSKSNEALCNIPYGS